MEVNYSFIVIAAISAVALLAFLIWRNQKDKKDLEDDMSKVNQDKPDDTKNDNNI
jgi:FtsZ-interacting cell division protein ZipA